jgi:hypothetical protein
MDLPNQPQPKTLLLLTLKQNLNNLSCLFRTLQLTKIEMIGQRDNAFFGRGNYLDAMDIC